LNRKNGIRGSIRFRLWDTEQHVCCTVESSISRYHFDVLKAKIYNYIKPKYNFYRKILHFKLKHKQSMSYKQVVKNQVLNSHIIILRAY